jgi:hypothetical protein
MVGRPSVKPVSSLAEVIRFGVFEADTRTGELRKHGLRIKLQEQPFQVLSLLLARPGELVTRDELRLKLWPADTFVDFEAPPLRPALPSPPAPHEFAGRRSPAAIDSLVSYLCLRCDSIPHTRSYRIGQHTSPRETTDLLTSQAGMLLGIAPPGKQDDCDLKADQAPTDPTSVTSRPVFTDESAVAILAAG